MPAIVYDLHVHTTASDGLLSPEELIMLAHSNQLRGIAITDHDTVSGLIDTSWAQTAVQRQITVIPGLEINTDFADEEVHILGYFIDVNNSELLQRLDQIKEARKERIAKILKRLEQMNMYVNSARVYEIAGSGTIGRPHIAQAMIERGYAATIKEAFNKYLARGRPAYVPRYRLLPDEAIGMIKRAGGFPVLAHPGLIRSRGVVDEIIKMGIGGLEVFYPEHTDVQIREMQELAAKYGLVITGGSDFHGTESTRNQLGCAGLDSLLYQRFIQQIQN
jgi:predicted metal-dependent phosphoesterase TrpH